MNNCIFCKIVSKEIPAHIIYEDDKVMALLDIAQTTPGHSLIIIKRHSDNITQAEDKDLQRAIKIAKLIATKQLKVLPGVIGVNIVNNVLAGAGQSVMHTHIHLVPRYQDDEFKIKWVNHHGEVNSKTMDELKQVLKL